MTQDELDAMLASHALWLSCGPGGVRANLIGANLRGADLRDANLRGAILSGCDLRGAILSGCDLRDADLSECDLREANLPSPTMVLLANWGYVSDALCVELMRYDAANHPDPSAFDRWAAGGKCPYDGVRWQRAANFAERRILWSPGPAWNALKLAAAILMEKCKYE